MLKCVMQMVRFVSSVVQIFMAFEKSPKQCKFRSLSRGQDVHAQEDGYVFAGGVECNLIHVGHMKCRQYSLVSREIGHLYAALRLH